MQDFYNVNEGPRLLIQVKSAKFFNRLTAVPQLIVSSHKRDTAIHDADTCSNTASSEGNSPNSSILSFKEEQ